MFTPSIIMAQEPQIPFSHGFLNDKVWSCSCLIFTKASKTIGPHSLVLTVYVFNLEHLITGSYLYISKYLIELDTGVIILLDREILTPSFKHLLVTVLNKLIEVLNFGVKGIIRVII